MQQCMMPMFASQSVVSASAIQEFIIHLEQIYFWKFYHSICDFGRDVEGIGRSEAIDSLNGAQSKRNQDRAT